MFVENDDTNEDIHAADRVLVAHRYNCNDNPLNVAPKKLYKNIYQLGYHQAGKSSHSSPTEVASNLYLSDIYQCVGCNSFNLKVRCFQIMKFLYFFFIKIVLHFNINAIPNEK